MARDDPQFQFFPGMMSGRLANVPLIGGSNPWDPQGVGLKASQRLSSGRSLASRPSTTPRQGLGAQPVQDASIPPAGRALLATIGGPGFESNGSYTQRFNQPDFTDFSKHPGTFGNITRGPNAGLKSNAAGRYQMLSTTFADQARKQNLPDFSPQSQDKAAWGLARETYAQKYPGRSLDADIVNPGNLPRIAQALQSKWTSLPGGLEQRGKLADFASAYMNNLKIETAAGAGQASANAQPPPRPMILTSDPWAITGSMSGQGRTGGPSASSPSTSSGLLAFGGETL